MNFKRAVAVVLVLATASSCGSGVSRFPPAAQVSFNLKLASPMSAQDAPMSGKRSVRGQVGAATTKGLTSLQLFVKKIAVCLNLTVSNTDFSAGLNCATLYTGPSGLDQGDPSKDQSALAQAARGTSSGYTDLMNSSSRGGLGTSGGPTGTGAGTFNWGYIQWAPPIKVGASLFDLSSPTSPASFFTQDGSTAGTNGGSGYTYVTTSTTSFTQGPAQTAVILEPSSGAWFRLLSPFKIAQTDVNSQNAFVVDLVFDPVGYVTAADSPVTGSVLTDGTNSIQIPPPRFLPIAHAPGATVIRESYVAPNPTGTTDSFDVNLDLYYLQGDSAKTIQAAAVRAVPNASSVTPITGQISQVAFFRGNPDGTLDFLDFANNPILTGLTRGAAGSVTIACQGVSPTTTFSPAGCTDSLNGSVAAPTTSSL